MRHGIQARGIEMDAIREMVGGSWADVNTVAIRELGSHLLKRLIVRPQIGVVERNRVRPFLEVAGKESR